ncbi:helix-turn-helix transcriptional regulator [Streptomyces platensis]|nr:helix-turn-helix transcriptional regulator [Streptomyces platensis]
MRRGAGAGGGPAAAAKQQDAGQQGERPGRGDEDDGVHQAQDPQRPRDERRWSDAVAVHRGVRGRRSGYRHGWDALTDTERIVASHVADGHSNPEIATLMSISRRTVSTRVSRILRKLAITSRVDLAAEFIRRTSQE